tara:strand:+ start:271 stop:1098 length:828 start_codon:yes stop_codon:yes gene_type:complete
MWFDIIKTLPNEEYKEDDRPKDKYGDSAIAQTKDSIESGDLNNIAIIFMPHYMKKIKERKTYANQHIIDSELEQKYASLSEGNYWHYLNSSVSDRSYLMVRVMTKGILPRTSIKVSSLMNKDEEKYEKVIVFHHINDGHPYNPNYTRLDVYSTGIKKGHRPKQQGGRQMPKPLQINRRINKSFTPLNEMEEWMQVFINSIYEMQRKLDRGTGRNWFDITDIIQKIAYMGEGAEHKDIMKLFRKIVEIIETKYKNGKELKKELDKIIQRRKGELYQ